MNRPETLSARVLELAEQLIACRSVTPSDGGCQSIIAQRLERIGFQCHQLIFGPEGGEVTNLWAVRRGGQGGAAPLLAFAGHTDVVPPGPASAWVSDPFEPTCRDGRLYGRGAADMKTSLAAMVVAIEDFVGVHPWHRGRIAMLLTSDEEGPSKDGTARVCDWLKDNGETLDYCIVGEPTSTLRLGDVIKNGRRGTLSGRLTVRGVQGHVAYPHLARNPIHQMAPALARLAATAWDAGSEHFPPTTWQVSNLHAGTGGLNVIPGEAVIDFNFRFGAASTPAQLQQKLTAVLDEHRLEYELRWTLGGEPFFTSPGTLSEVLARAVREETGLVPEFSTSGGTSDARFIRTICSQVMEFGPVNASIHQVDEHVAIDSLAPLSGVYRRVLCGLLG
ncbi:succinyl-diaminopimelate desuccinylase [Schlegelella sp. S2-27]|uniref:Succinyl-diaminopimelate desuccinylase n=1 Tax=Caldimonas mangrovi TaxID=2944811 RepID=A0ABT0YJM5_9BURK|nr:succinyl-diaminopimelate desuccinylase [Caldimonas mangrovi]MCM5678927.1 succinyl-diaminopimelate desuccinylase [Caldimonas mangrovi]